MTGATSVVTTRLDHIRINLDATRSRVGDRLVLAAVKANAYGHGAVEVASMIETTGAADWLGVAGVDEALELRAAGIGLPILKFSMERDPDAVRAAIEAGVTLTVADEASIEATASAALSAPGRRVQVHLKVDTGMRRIGCRPEDAPGLARRVDASGLELGGLFSHLPVSDVPSGNDFTSAQIGLFSRTAAAVEATRGPVPLKHLANSGAVLGHPQAWFDMVRPGIMIYGSYPDAETPRTVPLLPGLEWRSELSFVKPIRAGESVSYGLTWTAERDTVIGTVPTGYGDGYARLLSNRARVLVGGRSCAVAGRICMDQFMVDLGPDSSARIGDEVTLVGDGITTAELAGLIGTIPYEVTCLITRRPARRYRS